MSAKRGRLRLSGVRAGYGATVVLEDIDLTVEAGESVSIIGRNGVGKTTLLATVMGQATLHGGELQLNDESLQRLKSCQRVWRGLGYVPQERDIFSSLTVEENLAVACRNGHGIDRAFDLFPQLQQRRRHKGNQLSGGEQQMLAIGRALAGQPQILLMDEPTEGLAPVIIDQLQDAMSRLQSESATAIVLVEQNSRVALHFAARCLVMRRGRIVHDGSSEALRQDSALLDRLIGVDAGRSTQPRVPGQSNEA